MGAPSKHKIYTEFYQEQARKLQKTFRHFRIKTRNHTSEIFISEGVF